MKTLNRLFILGLFLLAPAAARAQFTTVTAAVADPSGIPYSGAIMNAILVPGASGGYTLGGQSYSGRVGPVTLDSAGKFTAQFGDVTLITPGSPQWQITIDSAAATIQGPLGTGPQTFTFTSTGTTISGSSPVSLTTALNALAPKLTNFITSGATIGGSITNTQVAFGSGTNTISGNAGFTFISPNLSIPTGGAFEVNSTAALALPGIPGGGNVAVGGATLPAITSGIADIAIGPVTMTLMTTGSHNVAIGAGAMNSAVSTVSNNTAVGDQALSNVGTSGNTAFGQNALNVLSSGTGDVAIGANAGVGTNGSNDTLVGTGAGSSLTGSTDILIGTGLGSAITSGNNNIGIGNNLVSLSPTASNQLDLGDVVLGTGINTPSSSTITFPGTVKTTAYQTATNCSSSASPAVCGSAAAGTVALPTNAVSSTLVVNTTAVTANSEIFVQTDDTLGTKLGVTCNSTLATLVGGITISGRVAGTSFTIANNVAVVTNPLCVSYHIYN